MRHDGVASGYTTPTGFRRLTSCQRNPRNRGVTHGLNILQNWSHIIINYVDFKPIYCAISLNVDEFDFVFISKLIIFTYYLILFFFSYIIKLFY